MKIGFDIGDTLLDRNGRTFSLYSQEERRSLFQPFKGSLQVIETLCTQLGRENVYIISKCDQETEEQLIDWLSFHKFIGENKILQENIFFCRERKDKAPIIKSLGLNVFVDDRIEIFESIQDYPIIKMIFNKRSKQKDMGIFNGEDVLIFDDWAQFFDMLNFK